MVKQISDNEIYLLIKYIKSVLWRVVKRLSYIEDARCLKVKESLRSSINVEQGATALMNTYAPKRLKIYKDFFHIHLR